MVNERLTAISNNLFSDGRYDLRSTINIVEMDDNQFYCLFTSNNKELKEYFETILIQNEEILNLLRKEVNNGK